MGNSRWFSIYERLPVPLQDVACSLAGLKIRYERHNKVFWDALEFLEASQWWSLEEQKAYQNQKLRELIRHAYDTVPYYNEIFKERKLTPDDIKTAEDLYKLPVLEKETVRGRAADLVSRAWPQNRVVHGKTGGTTGKAIHFQYDKDTQPWQWAVWWRHRKRFGLDVHDPFVVFAGRNVVPLSSMEPPIWRRNLPMNQTYVSIHHMTEQNMRPLVEYLQTRQVSFYSGYPSGLYLLATYLLDNNIRLKHPPKVVSTGAESLLPHQRSVIEEALDSEICDQYGASEQVGNISECEHHSYHVDMEFGVVEFLPMEGMPSNTGRIVCTGLHNPVMPLIRYNIGDIATLSEHKCPCGRSAPTVESIDGRIESYILTPDGRQLGRLDFFFKNSHEVKEAQLVQDSLETVRVRVVREETYSTKTEEGLTALMRQYLGDVIEIEYEYLEEIPRAANGKFRQIVSKVFSDRYAKSNDTTQA